MIVKLSIPPDHTVYFYHSPIIWYEYQGWKTDWMDTCKELIKVKKVKKKQQLYRYIREYMTIVNPMLDNNVVMETMA